MSVAILQIVGYECLTYTHTLHIRNIASFHFTSVELQYQDIENRGLLQMPAFNEQYCQVNVSSENNTLVSNMIAQPEPAKVKSEFQTVNVSGSAFQISGLEATIQEEPSKTQPCC
jgi:hypothetical protein